MQSKSKKHMKKLTSILGLAGVAFSALSGHAQVFDYSNGDLILDISKSGSPDLEVDLGSLSSVTSAAQADGGTVQLNAYSSAQLQSAFGASTSGLTFQVFGTEASGTASQIVNYLTEAGNPNSTPNDYTTSVTKSISAAIQQKIIGSGNSTGILPWSSQNPAGLGNTATVAIIPTSGATSVNSFTVNSSSLTGLLANQGALGNTTPGSFSGSIFSDLYGYEAAGGLGSALPAGSSSQYDGYFTFNSDGSLDFTEAVVPAPESGYYGAMAGGGLLLLSLRRQLRRQQA
jgi:hypothetical protein